MSALGDLVQTRAAANAYPGTSGENAAVAADAAISAYLLANGTQSFTDSSSKVTYFYLDKSNPAGWSVRTTA